MNFNPPFPNGEMSPLLKKWGFQESDILEIRKIITDEIKRQNDESRFKKFRINKDATGS